jgi:hypothetical protein
MNLPVSQSEEERENNVQDRMIITPLKTTDLFNHSVFRDVEKVVEKMPRTVTYILDVFGWMEQ